MEGCLLRVRDLTLISGLSDGPTLDLSLLENLKTYCLWSHPFLKNDGNGYDSDGSDNDSLN